MPLEMHTCRDSSKGGSFTPAGWQFYSNKEGSATETDKLLRQLWRQLYTTGEDSFAPALEVILPTEKIYTSI